MRILFLFVFCVPAFLIRAQVDFNQYQPLKSVGNVPTDFSTPTREKIQKAPTDYLKDLSGKERELFIEEVNYAIDELLKSGQVTFGDPVSNYIQNLGELLTKDDPELNGKLRFYTYNTNEANAFSTDQGMVFVTTGLIAQLTNEAQLAFVLAHEIIHYREKHVVDLFDYSTDNSKFSYSEKVRLFSKYSRDNEFEADSLAVALVHNAGFNPSEINVTFDVLLYSYLPFEELVFDKDYFNNQWMYVPEKAFENEKKEISARSNYNDRLNSHPNVAKRKEELTKKIATFENWGTTMNRDANAFNEIRNICRFEFVLNYVYEDATTDALYGVYILEKQFPDSRFLRNCKSQVWLNLMKHEKRREIFDYEYDYEYYEGDYGMYNYSFYEGNIATLDRFITKLPKEGKIAMGLRLIHDNYSKDTTDTFAKSLWEKALEFTAYNDIFEDIQFSKYTFHEAIAEIEREKQVNDSIKEEEGIKAYTWNKYETIKNQKLGMDSQAGIDSTKFYLYGVSDLVKDSLFQQRVAFYTEKMKDENAEEDGLYELTDDELSDYYNEEFETKLHLGIDNILLINPLVYETVGYRSIDYKKSDVLEKRFIETITSEAKRNGITVNQLDRSDQHNMSSEDYSNLSQLMRSLNKRIDESGVTSFMLDEENLARLRQLYGTSHVVLFDLQHEYNPQIYLGQAVLATIFFPVGLIYFPAKLLSGHTTEMNCYVLDLEKGELVLEQSYFANEPASKKFLELRLNGLFHQLKQEKP